MWLRLSFVQILLSAPPDPPPANTRRAEGWGALQRPLKDGRTAVDCSCRSLADPLLHPPPPFLRCSSDFVGRRCQFQNLCLSSPCKNGGTCHPVVDGNTADYVCSCRLGYIDKLCLTMEDNACLSGPCRNGGSCDLVTLTEYKCRCPPGWSGERATGTHSQIPRRPFERPATPTLVESHFSAAEPSPALCV